MNWRNPTLCMLATLLIAVGCSPQMRPLPRSKFLTNNTDMLAIVKKSASEGIEWGGGSGSAGGGSGGWGSRKQYGRIAHADFKGESDAAEELLKAVAEKLVEAVETNGGQPSALKESSDGAEKEVRFEYTEGSWAGTVQVTLRLEFYQSNQHPHRLDVTIDEHSGE